MSLKDAPRFRGGIEIKTPSETRKLKALVRKAKDESDLLAAVVQLSRAPAYSHKVPKSFDKHTGEPAKYVWRIQSEKIETVVLLLKDAGASVASTCTAPEHLVENILSQMHGNKMMFNIPDPSDKENTVNVLVWPVLAPVRQYEYKDPKIIGIEVFEVKTVKLD